MTKPRRYRYTDEERQWVEETEEQAMESRLPAPEIENNASMDRETRRILEDDKVETGG